MALSRLSYHNEVSIYCKTNCVAQWAEGISFASLGAVIVYRTSCSNTCSLSTLALSWFLLSNHWICMPIYFVFSYWYCCKSDTNTSNSSKDCNACCVEFIWINKRLDEQQVCYTQLDMIVWEQVNTWVDMWMNKWMHTWIISVDNGKQKGIGLWSILS